MNAFLKRSFSVCTSVAMCTPKQLCGDQRTAFGAQGWNQTVRVSSTKSSLQP